MKSLLLLAVGAAAGFVAAHQVAKTPAGRQFFDDGRFLRVLRQHRGLWRLADSKLVRLRHQ